MDRIESSLCAIHYHSLRDIEMISTRIIGKMQNIHFSRIFEQLDKITHHFRSQQSIDQATLSSMTVEFLTVQAIMVFIERSTRCELRNRLMKMIFETIIIVAQRNLWLDEDGKRQLIWESNRPIPIIKFWDQYATHVMCIESAIESYGLDMKLRFHNLSTKRNYNIPPADETSLLENLFDRDINLLSAFPRILQTNKKAVLIAMGHFQKIRVSQEDYIANFSQMSTALQNDQEILDAACSSPRSIHLVKMLCEILRSDDQRFIELIHKRGCLLQFATEKQQNSKEFVIQAIRADPGAYIYASDARKNDQEVLFNLVLDGVNRDMTKGGLKKNASRTLSLLVGKIVNLATSFFKALTQIFQTFEKTFSISCIARSNGSSRILSER